MKKELVIIAIAMFSTMLFTRCGEEQDDALVYHLSVDKTALVFTAEVTSQIFSITASGEWYIEADGLESDLGSYRGSTDWYSVEPISGNGGVKVTVALIGDAQATQATATLKIIGQNDKGVTVKINR